MPFDSDDTDDTEKPTVSIDTDQYPEEFFEDVELPDAATEEESERDGAFSYAAESHAFTNGLYHGVTTHPLRRPPEPADGQAAKDYEKEPHYFRGGYILGTLAQLAGLGYVALKYGPEAVAAFVGLP